jgi:hypothetical protein
MLDGEYRQGPGIDGCPHLLDLFGQGFAFDDFSIQTTNFLFDLYVRLRRGHETAFALEQKLFAAQFVCPTDKFLTKIIDENLSRPSFTTVHAVSILGCFDEIALSACTAWPEFTVSALHL